MGWQQSVQDGLAGSTESSRLEAGDVEASGAACSRCSWHNQDPWWSETKGYKKQTNLRSRFFLGADVYLSFTWISVRDARLISVPTQDSPINASPAAHLSR